jgi:hypothetical protein
MVVRLRALVQRRGLPHHRLGVAAAVLGVAVGDDPHAEDPAAGLVFALGFEDPADHLVRCSDPSASRPFRTDAGICGFAFFPRVAAFGLVLLAPSWPCRPSSVAASSGRDLPVRLEAVRLLVRLDRGGGLRAELPVELELVAVSVGEPRGVQRLLRRADPVIAVLGAVAGAGVGRGVIDSGANWPPPALPAAARGCFSASNASAAGVLIRRHVVVAGRGPHRALACTSGRPGTGSPRVTWRCRRSCRSAATGHHRRERVHHVGAGQVRDVDPAVLHAVLAADQRFERPVRLP